MNQKYLISVVGPTAIGKTTLSIQLARHFNTEIISADSRQFYKEMQIGTAAPTPTELASVKHHFIHHKSIEEAYNVGAFEKDAIKLLDNLFLSRNIVIMVGGSGLYIDAVIKGLDDFPEIDAAIRTSLNLKLESEGLEVLQNQLKQLDLNSFETIEINNPHRVIRALEVCIGTGNPYSTYLKQNKNDRSFKSIIIGLTSERQQIYNRINQRVDIMMTDGLLKEVRGLTSRQHLNSLNTVGYKELFNYLNDEWELDFAVSEIKKNSRRYAKRQLTWFKKNEKILWFDNETHLENIIKTIQNAMNN